MTDGEHDSAPGPAPDGDGPDEGAEEPDLKPPVTPPDASRADEFPQRGRSGNV
ncbi:hypothetical protein ACWDMR_33010 [Streptomyces althioticus]|jgi:hypothetical protein|uniref:hypothetical protein n=1 Tax=Actinomycetes TaxID=1760 RepID=UPI000AD7A42D|nr:MULTISPECIES: hypothetical protein [Actinomycetes]MCC9690508.1 hypothetical protein [Streptomyces sp. MNU103]WTB96811.1 hypothetical protein OHA53_00480 [Streptomyces althioticus]GGT37608.1 hypothetical protein GCM10010243_13180 [Streptomyces matensis]MBM4832951.1 hypothetical protein [Actinospica acidiphila]GGQ39687.1 hypothetical protein GCM10010250_06950 [Streptomyces althioticus]